ncbi:hypothetical protein CFC21_064228 [Triticum aestivum]|uniref:Uncharacterized protein n=2 Tax=Triticum aestivum TaxID=4565 RepID=A0A9R1KJX9_WHEAT|nr:hypothetical protein CFC21_064228 [Triticum aestivum]
MSTCLNHTVQYISIYARLNESSNRCHFAYNVPATLVLICVMLPGKSFASPKSDILGLRSLSSRMLLALMSRWTICGRISSCRYVRPSATPMQIFALVLQSNRILLWALPEEHHDKPGGSENEFTSDLKF